MRNRGLDRMVLGLRRPFGDVLSCEVKRSDDGDLNGLSDRMGKRKARRSGRG